MNQEREARQIMFVIGSMGLGGAENQMALLTTELAQRGWHVTLFSLEDGPLRSTFESGGVRVIVSGYDRSVGRLRKVGMLVRGEFDLIRLLMRERPNVVHAFLPLTNLMASLAARAVAIPVIVTSRRGLGTHQDRHRGWRWFDRLANACSTVVTVNSSAVANDTVARDGIAREKLVLIYNGLRFSMPGDIEQVRAAFRSELRLANDDIAIVCVANLIPYKGHAELIDAFATLRHEGRKTVLHLVGEDRGIGASLAARAAEAGVVDSVKFLGRRTDVKALLFGMDIGVMASHEEGFSNAVLEKLAAGLPVVATSVGGNPEALAGVPDCALVEPKNADSLAHGMREVINGLTMIRERQKARSQMVINRYSVKAVVDQHEALYAAQWSSSR